LVRESAAAPKMKNPQRRRLDQISRPGGHGRPTDNAIKPTNEQVDREMEKPRVPRRRGAIQHNDEISRATAARTAMPQRILNAS